MAFWWGWFSRPSSCGIWMSVGIVAVKTRRWYRYSFNYTYNECNYRAVGRFLSLFLYAVATISPRWPTFKFHRLISEENRRRVCGCRLSSEVKQRNTRPSSDVQTATSTPADARTRYLASDCDQRRRREHEHCTRLRLGIVDCREARTGNVSKYSHAIGIHDDS